MFLAPQTLVTSIPNVSLPLLPLGSPQLLILAHMENLLYELVVLRFGDCALVQLLGGLFHNDLDVSIGIPLAVSVTATPPIFQVTQLRLSVVELAAATRSVAVAALARRSFQVSRIGSGGV